VRVLEKILAGQHDSAIGQSRLLTRNQFDQGKKLALATKFVPKKGSISPKESTRNAFHVGAGTRSIGRCNDG